MSAEPNLTDRSFAARKTAGAHVCRALVIDDNTDAADMMAMLVEMYGGASLTAYDGDSGARLAIEARPDIVFLDLGMTPVDGFQACRRIRASLGSAITIVALTGYGQQQDRRRTADAGFDAHLTKPADPVRVAELLAAAARRSPRA